VSAFVDTNVLVRHLTGDPPAMAARATAYLASASDLYLTDLIVAETVYVLESFYEVPRSQIAEVMQSLVAFSSIVTVDPALLLRAIEVYEVDRLDFAEAYLVACAESTGIGAVASFDKAIDRLVTVERIEPPRHRADVPSIREGPPDRSLR
jgi:predicted nucleic acid-binding protein